MSLALSAPSVDDPTIIPRGVLIDAKGFLKAIDNVQRVRRIRAQQDGGTAFNIRHCGGERNALAFMVRRFRAAALAEGVAPRILWARAREIG